MLSEKELNDFYINYTKLKENIEFLNNPQFPYLDQIINRQCQVASNDSWEDWKSKIPNEFFTYFFGNDKFNFDENYKYRYSIPFLHLKNIEWAKAIISKQYFLSKIEDFKYKNKPYISELADNLYFLLKNAEYTDIKQDLVEKCKSKVLEHLHVIKEIDVLKKSSDFVLPNLSCKFNDLVLNKNFYADFFTTNNSTGILIDDVSFDIQTKYTTILYSDSKVIQNKIKKLWEQVLSKNIEAQLNNIKFSSLQKIINLNHENFEIENYFSSPADFFKTPSSKLKELYNFNDDEINQINYLYKSIKRKAFPNFSNKYLTNDQLELLRLIYKYKTFKKVGNEKLDALKEKIENLSKQYNILISIAKNRYYANFFNDIQFSNWIAKEMKIYEDYIPIAKLWNQLFNFENIPDDKLTKDFHSNSSDYFSVIDEVVGFNYSSDTLPDYLIEEVLKQKLITNGLKISALRKYQSFAAKYILKYKKVLLGDEMGLGKTVEALATINHLYHFNKRYFVVFMPLSVLYNWKSEIENKTEIPYYIFRGINRTRNFYKWKDNGGILILNYEQSNFLKNLIDKEQINIDMVVVDEAHSIKNPEAQRTQNISHVLKVAPYILLMTGTPLENKISEMTFLISLLNPKKADEISTYSEISAAVYKELIATVYLRRKRDDVLAELPEKITIPVYTDFTDYQRTLYKKELLTNNCNIMKLRRIAFEGDQSEKIDQIKEICRDAKENNEKVLIFSFFKYDVIFKLQKLLNGVASKPITGDLSANERLEVINTFSESKDEYVLLAQITAGGIGLNIQAASRIIICEPQYKPSIQNQAISRAYRMGQTRKVTVYQLLTKDSIDESLMEIIYQKEYTFDKFADKSEAALRFEKYTNDKQISNKKLDEMLLSREKARVLNG